jgi:hypothetical protein
MSAVDFLVDPTLTDPSYDPSFNQTPYADPGQDGTQTSISTDPASGNPWQTLTGVLQTGVNAYIDGQTAKYLTSTQPGMRVQYGAAGNGHYFTVGGRGNMQPMMGGVGGGGNSQLLLIGGALLVAFLVFKKV